MKQLSISAQITRQRKMILRRSNELLIVRFKMADLAGDAAIIEKDIINMQLELDVLRAKEK